MTIKTENWLGEYTSTIGTGDITLGGAIDGFAGFSNVGENVDVYYTVVDALDKETGIGTLTGGKLVRKDIHATLVDGAYVKNGSAINLSGDAQVYGTANAHFLDYVQAVANAEIVNAQAIAELKALQINGHALTASFNLTAADVGAHPDSWMPSTEVLNVYQKDASDIRYLKTQDAEQVAGLVMRVGGAREQQLQQSINDLSTAFIGNAPPAGAPVGKLWFDTESGRTYIKYNDGDSTQWIEESPQGLSPDGLESRIDEALRRSYAEAGYNVVGTFQAGFTYVNANDVGIDEVTGKGFTGPAGDVDAGTDPASGGFVDRSGALLRADVYIIINEKRRNISHYLTKAEFEDAQTGNPQLDTTAAWNSALNDSSIRALDFKGGFKVTGAGKACITQTENISLHGNNRRDTFIRADNAGANTAILDLAIANNGGMGDVRGWAAEHFTIFHNAGGASCILNDSGLPMLECRIVDIGAQAGVTAGSRDLVLTRFAFSKVEQCSFGSGVTCGLPAHQSPDGNKFLMNNFFGTPTALILDIESGAYRTEVWGGAMVTRDGGVRVLQGSQIAIRSVHFEQFIAYGQSQSPEKAHIAILGYGQLSDSILIEGNNFGGGTNCDYLVWVGNAFDTDITKNVMNAPAVADVYTSVNAQFTKPRTDNVVKGNQSNPRPGNVRFPMVVADNGYGTYNVLHQQTALANGWLGGSFYLNEMNEIVIDTGFNAGVTAPGTLVATMQDGFRPADFYALAAASSAGVGVINANPITGQLIVGLAPSNSQLGCQMRFHARRG